MKRKGFVNFVYSFGEFAGWLIGAALMIVDIIKNSVDIGIMTPLQKGHFLRRYRHMYGFGYCKSTICSGCLMKS